MYSYLFPLYYLAQEAVTEEITEAFSLVAFGTQVVIWVAIGGRGTLIRPLIAAILLGQIQDSAERVTQDWQLVVGVLLLIVVLFIPDGLVGSIAKLFPGKGNSRITPTTNNP